MPLIKQVFSQREWPGAGDVDDCWVLSALQGVNAVAPWVSLPSVTTFRAKAGDPDDGVTDGGNATEILRGLRALYPQLAKLHNNVGFLYRDGVTFAQFEEDLQRRGVVSAMVLSSALPAALQYGFKGLHQVTFEHESGVGYWAANPLQEPHSKPTRILSADLERALKGFGNGKCYGIFMPQAKAAFTTNPFYVPPTVTQVPGTYSQAQLDAAVAQAVTALKTEQAARLAEIRHGLEVFASAVK